MKHSFLCLVILTVAVSCLRDDSASRGQQFVPVEQYVALLKSGNFNYWEMPVYEISDIPQLLKHIRNEYIIPVIVSSPFLSAGAEKISTTAGMMILWTIEGTRLDVDHPSLRPVVVDHANRHVPQKDVADLYERWWEQNRKKTVTQLKEISPFEGTDFHWD